MNTGEVLMHLQKMSRVLGGFRYRYGSEVQLHESLEQVLTDAGYSFAREHVLDEKNRADFWLDGVVVEVKVAGTVTEALRQVNRYIHLPQVTGVLLAGTPRWAGQPLVKRPQWGGKPFGMTQLRRQAL